MPKYLFVCQCLVDACYRLEPFHGGAVVRNRHVDVSFPNNACWSGQRRQRMGWPILFLIATIFSRSFGGVVYKTSPDDSGGGWLTVSVSPEPG